MNQLSTPLNIKAKFKDLAARHKGIQGSRKVLSDMFGNNDLGIFQYLHFGLKFSSLLHEVGRVEDYKRFIKQYNQSTTEIFYETTKFIDEIYTQLGLKVNMLAVLNKPRFILDDKTNIFNGNQFNAESDLEKNMFNYLNSWSHDWKIKRQQDIGFGKCDITIEFNKGNAALELKKGKADRKDVYQAYEYSQGNSGYQPILVAQDFFDDALTLAKELNVNCYEYCFARVDGFSIPYSFYLFPAFEFKQESSIDKEFEEIHQCDGFVIEFGNIPKSEEAHILTNNEIEKLNSAIKTLARHIENNPYKKSYCPNCNAELHPSI